MIRVAFNGREPSPYHIDIANKTDHNVENVVFDVPTIDENQVITLNVLLSDGTGDAITLTDNTLNVVRDLTGVSGDVKAWVTLSVDTTKVWNSNVLLMSVGDLPNISETIEKQYPTALQSAIAATTAAQEAAEAAQGLAEEAVEHYPEIRDGIWYVWDAENEQFISTGVSAIGPQGATGATGARGPQGVKGDTGDKGDKGDTGDAFHIVKTYSSRAAMNADYAHGDVKIGEYVMIVTNEQDPDNAKVYIKGNVAYEFVVDMSGASGIQGPAGPAGADGYSPTATVTKSGSVATIIITDKNGTTTATVSDGAGGGGTSDYTDLTNKPSIESVTLSGNKTASDLGLAKASDLSGKQAKITASGILKGDGNGGVSAATVGTDYGTYSKPSGGIPASDLASGVIPSVPSASSATPQPLGTADAGSSTDYSRADHVHAKPTAADVGAVPIETYNPVSKTESMTQNVGLDENGRLWTNPGSSGSGIGSDQLVFDYTFSGNWHKINVTAINYSTGVITLEANSAPFTDDYNTAPRVVCVPLFENVNAQLKYGFMPPEMWSLPRGNGRGVLVGTNQIKLYSGAETSIDSITETANIDLTRFQIWVETSRNHAVNSVIVSDLDFSHKYKISMFFPYGSFHKTSCIAIKKGNNISYGEGHGTGYAINTQANLRGNDANFHSVTLNSYEIISLRNVYYAYTDLLYLTCPILLEGELHKISDGTWILDSSIMYANWGSNAPAATKTPSFITNSGRVYLNTMPTTIKFESGNANTILDGTKIQIWDIGTSVSSTIVTNVSGSTPSITGVADHRYVCGECSTLSITAPASGCIDVVFESGSTATVLTVTSAKSGVSAIKWANGFDPTSLDANTTYEINILDGEFGVVGSWA